jgi:hypothetical protein
LLFRFYPLRFHFTAQEPLFFPEGKAANILRGALGILFRRTACDPLCTSAADCPLRHACAYARVFEPATSGAGPSGLADWPRPFVFRARSLDGRHVRAGEAFCFDVHVFLAEREVLDRFVQTFSLLAWEGLGPGRGKAELRRVTNGTQVLYDVEAGSTREEVAPVSLDLAPPAIPATRVTVEFLTPTELKYEGGLAARPEFPVLFGRLRDRIAMLSRLYGAVPLPIDYEGTSERALRVRMTRCTLRHRELARRSSKTGQSHSIGGFTGVAEYEGDLTEFLPYLEAGRWTGVGRQCVWGKGEIAVTGPADPPS